MLRVRVVLEKILLIPFGLGGYPLSIKGELPAPPPPYCTECIFDVRRGGYKPLCLDSIGLAKMVFHKVLRL